MILMNQNLSDFPERGSITILALAMLGILLAISALAINVTYVYLVRSELQTAADSAALNAVNYLYLNSNLTPSYGTINTTLVSSKAKDAASAHLVTGSLIDKSEVYPNVVHWDFTTNSVSTNNKLTPAVDVTVKKNAVLLFIGNFMGLPSIDLSARAIAVTPSPYNVRQGEIVLPFGLANCMYGPTSPDTLTIVSGDFVGFSGCMGGRWAMIGASASTSPTNLTSVINGSLIQPATKIGDAITTRSGVVQSAFSDLKNCLNNYTCKNVAIVPIFNETPLINGSTTQTTIVGFACVLLAVPPSGEITLTKTTGCKVNYSANISPNFYGVYTAPRLVY